MKMRNPAGRITAVTIFIIAVSAAGYGFFYLYGHMGERMEKERRLVVEELRDSFRAPYRRMEITVEEVSGGKEAPYVTLSCDTYGHREKKITAPPLCAHGEVIQVQAILITFRGLELVRNTEPLNTRFPVFLNLFLTGGDSTEQIVLTEYDEVPAMYRIPGRSELIQKQVWERIWEYALDPDNEDSMVIKNIVIRPVEGAFEENITYKLTVTDRGDVSKSFRAVTNFEPVRKDDNAEQDD
ncbi:MAG: hypothetical protein GF392_02490 [Candidatus Omnitrophica bacterium]|nr:hypothetical protein [Candidatus Omnitrophota bacterium]